MGLTVDKENTAQASTDEREAVIVSEDLRYNEETEAAMREAREIAAGRISAVRYGSAAEALRENDDN